jgi:hypothetical protein
MDTDVTTFTRAHEKSPVDRREWKTLVDQRQTRPLFTIRNCRNFVHTMKAKKPNSLYSQTGEGLENYARAAP